MVKLFLYNTITESADSETPAQTRDRLKVHFPPGSVRRMTQLGMLIGSVLKPMLPAKNDTLIYSSEFGESRALENYLESFPHPSPTLFQTSIHPSGVQQGLISTQSAIEHLFPISGGPQGTVEALLIAALASTNRSIFCGGEERATWLTEHEVASAHTFAFSCELSTQSKLTNTPQASIELLPTIESGSLPIIAWHDLLLQRQPFNGPAADGWHLHLHWLSQ